MAMTLAPAVKPSIQEVYNSTNPQLHWYEPGHGPRWWTPERDMAQTIREVTVHWTDHSAAPTPSNATDSDYLRIIGQIAYYHGFQRDWDDKTPGRQMGDGIMYHYVIVPTGTIFQTTPETARTWNAGDANAHNIAIAMLAGWADKVQPPAQQALEALLDWFVSDRDDLPLVTANPTAINLPEGNGRTRTYHTLGVTFHDEVLKRYGQRPKGCCGVYKPVVTAWRARHLVT